MIDIDDLLGINNVPSTTQNTGGLLENSPLGGIDFGG